MLKLKDTPTQPVVLTTEALEARVAELEFEKLQSETEQLMVSAEGYRNIGTVLNFTGVLSLEAAALAEVAEQLVGGGSSNLSDSLESHVVSGLEAEGKGEGFMAKAKELGAKIMEKIKKMIAWITDKLKSLGVTKAKKIKDAIDELGVKLENIDKESTVTVPKYVAELIESSISNELRTFLKDDPFKQFDGAKIYESLDNWKTYIDRVVKNLITLSSAVSPSVTEGFVLDKIPSDRTISFKMSPDLVKITMEPIELMVSDRGTVDIKVSKIMQGISTMQKDIWYLFNFVSMNSRGMDKFNSGLGNLFGELDDPRLLGTHMVLMRVIAVEIPTLALDGFQQVSDAVASLKTEKQKGVAYPS